MNNAIYLTFLCSLLLLFGVNSVKCDYFSSTSKLKELVKLEQELKVQLRQYAVNIENKLKAVERYLSESLDFDEESTVENPLATLHLLKRLTSKFDELSEIQEVDNWQEIQNFKSDGGWTFPDNSDVYGTMAAILRLQQTYKLNKTELVHGKIFQYQAPYTLAVEDCKNFAKIELGDNNLKSAKEWLQEAVTLQGIQNEASNEEIVNDYTTRPYIIHNEEIEKFSSMCREENLQPISGLHCRFHAPDPYLILQPVKLEEISLDPYMVVFHNLLSDAEIERIQLKSAPELSRDHVPYNHSDGGEGESGIRISQIFWLPEDDPLTSRLTRKAKMVTGLDTQFDEQELELPQVGNYGMGGHFGAHFDFLNDGESGDDEVEGMSEWYRFIGDRTATLMFYLNDVKLGGATAFPRLGVSVKPEKGAAFFWYNLKMNGEADFRSLHGGCPVLYGTKWVVNIWFHEISQAFRRRCTLNKDD